jgi:CBS domain-containing protein
MTSKNPSVTDVMTTRPLVFRVDASLEEVDIVLRSTIITGLPVVDRDGSLVGVVTHADLTAYRFAHPSHPVEAAQAEPAPAKK